MTSSRIVEVTAKLLSMGVPVLPGDNWGSRSLLEISAEDHTEAPDGMPWADYYLGHGQFGVHDQLVNVLHEYGLYAEWVNPGVLAVYNA